MLKRCLSENRQESHPAKKVKTDPDRSFESIVREGLDSLERLGYCVIPGVLNQSEVSTCLQEFFEWYDPLVDTFGRDNVESAGIHGIFKCHEVGHHRAAWRIRTHPRVREVFETLYETDQLVTSFDGTCYMRSDLMKRDTNEWMHTDQTMNSRRMCVQSWVSLTDNDERCLMVMEGSHREHRRYFADHQVAYSSRNWHKIVPEYLDANRDRIKKLRVRKGDMVLWDSRTFHRNTYGSVGNGEARIVQYVCMLPKRAPGNTASMQKKRQLYFDTRRTTSHWAYPIRVNAKQPQTYGDDSKLIDYDRIVRPDLSDMMPEIRKLL